MTIKLSSVLTLTLLVVVCFGGALFVHASEVTGTLSASNSAITNDTAGTLSGSVTGSSGSGGGGSRSSGGRSSGDGQTTTQPAGQVLGAATSSIPSPAFPNAGEPVDPSGASTVLVLALGALALAVLMFVRRKARV